MMHRPNILAAEQVERRLELARLPSGWPAVAGILLLVLLLAAVVFFYTHEQRSGASARARRFLAGLRCLTLLLLALVWLEPILATYLHRRSEAYTLVLLDSSASMSLSDRYADPAEAARIKKVLDELGGLEPPVASDIEPTAASGAQTTRPDRWALVRHLLGRQNARLLRQLAAGNCVKVVRFGDSATPVGELEVAGRAAADSAEQPVQPDRTGETPVPQGTRGKAIESLQQALFSAGPDMPVTDIGRAVRQAVESVGSNPIAALVVFSDGGFNQGEPVEVVAQYARDKRIPVYAVGIGDPSPPRNLAVAAVEAPPNVFVQDPFKLTAHLRTEGFRGEALTVELLERRAGRDTPQVIDTRRVQVPLEGPVQPIVFDHRIGEAAEQRLAVRVAAHESETVADDNTREVTVRALANKMRVLLSAGAPSWEYRYLTRLLERDKTADVSCWLQSAEQRAVREGNTIIDHFPRDPAELAQYDCVVLLDPQPGDINTSWTSEVEKLIADRGCGLLYVAGRKNTPRLAHDPQSRAMLDLLPVVIDAGEADLVLNELGHFQRTDWPPAVPPAVANHPVLAMSDLPEENVQVWSRLGGVFWHYPVRREKPVATVLLRHSNPAMHNAYGNHVLLATQFVGSGRTGFLGFDSTWRWRRFGDEYFNRFWIQLLRHMVEGKLLSGQRRGFVQVEPKETSVGEPVVLEARLLDSNYQPLAQPEVGAVITVEGAWSSEVKLLAQVNRPGWYRGRFVPTRLGLHSVRIDLPAERETDRVSIRGELNVGRPDLEFRHASLDRDALELLALRSAGGRYLNADQVDELAGLIPSKVTTLTLNGQPISIWDRWWTLAAVVFLLGVEWFVRKRVHLL